MYPAAIYNEAKSLRQRGDLKQALSDAEQGLSQVSAQTDAKWHWRFLLLKADVLISLGRAPEALKLLQVLPFALPDDAEIQARLLLDQGFAESALSHFSEAKPLFDQALRVAESHQLWPLVAEAKLRRGAVLVRQGEAEAGEADFRDALHLARQLNDTYLETSALGNLAVREMNRGRYDEAVFSFSQVIALSGQLQSKSIAARNFNNLGYCYLQLGQPEKAAPLFDQAQQLAKQTGVLRDQQIGLGRMGDWCENQDDYNMAFSYYQRALETARQAHDAYWTAKWLYQGAAALISIGDLARAEQYNRQALELEGQIGSPVEGLFPKLNLARIADSRKQFKQAQLAYRAVIDPASKLRGVQDAGLLLEARGGLANLLVEMHRYTEAEAEFQRALAFANVTRAELQQDEYRITYFASLVHLYQDYVDFLVSKHRDLDALKVVESSRARVLAERLGGTGPVANRVALYDYRSLARGCGTTLLSYWLAPERSFLWVVTPEQVMTFRLPRQSEIETLVAAYNGAIQGLRDPVREDSETGRKLYDTLLAPARPYIRTDSNVTIVPDGALHNLNFESLPATDADPHYWIENVAISVVPSLDLAYRHSIGRTTVGHMGSGPETADSLLLFGDPMPPKEANYAKLPNATSEISEIQQQFQRAVTITGTAADPHAYAASKPEGFSMIHFAAHAEANREDPLDSAIILSPSDESYKLYARDVVNLPIRANLVTISACRSAGGRAYAGEGLVGFAWAFLQAGASNVVAGLWEVDDRSTADLMKTMYSELRSGKTPQQSLRAAKLALLHSGGSYRKPYYWAPFQLITDSLTTRTEKPIGERTASNAGRAESPRRAIAGNALLSGRGRGWINLCWHFANWLATDAIHAERLDRPAVL
jgi:CHAT domain-containing protein/Tfp pilus assembly protein PilF